MQPDSAAPVSPADRFFEFALLGLLASGFLAVVGSGYLDTPTTVIITPAVSNDEAATLFPGFKTHKPYLRTTKQPS